jgi:putative hydroxymethylpyrimidine transport system substrate-binding protein
MKALKRSSRWLVYVAILAALIILLILLEPLRTGVKSDQTAKVNSPAIAAAASNHIRIMLDEYPNASHAYIYAAEANGYFRDQGLRVDIRMPSGVVDSLSAISQGQVDLAIVRGPEVLLAREAEQPVVSIAAIIRRPLDYLTVAHDSPIHSPLHLIDKKVGHTGASYYSAIIRQMMTNEKLDMTETELIEMPSIAVDASLFKKPSYDAYLGLNVGRDRLTLEKKGISIRMIDPKLYGVPAYYDRVLVANSQALEENEELYTQIWTALAQGQQYVAEHPEQAIQNMMSRQSARNPLDQDIELESLRMLLPIMASSEEPFGYQSKDVWADTIKWLTDMEMLSSNMKADDVYKNSVEVD